MKKAVPLPAHPCARTRCKRPGVLIHGRAIRLCVKHHATLGTGRSKLERRVKVAGEARAFGSAWEAERGRELRVLEEAGEIHGLEFQVYIPLRIKGGVCVVAADYKHRWLFSLAVPVAKDSARVESYVADAIYREDGEAVVEDSKNGRLSPEFRRKEKWMKEGYGITIRVVHKARGKK